MPSYLIPTVLIVAAAFVLFAGLDYLAWELRHWLAERAYRAWEEANKPE